MFLDYAVHVVGHVSPYHDAILGLTLHGLGVYVVMFCSVLYQPAVFLELLKLLLGTLIYPRVIFRNTRLKINLGLDDVIQALLVGTGLNTGLLGV